jgi:hypothetical protein
VCLLKPFRTMFNDVRRVRDYMYGYLLGHYAGGHLEEERIKSSKLSLTDELPRPTKLLQSHCFVSDILTLLRICLNSPWIPSCVRSLGWKTRCHYSKHTFSWSSSFTIMNTVIMPLRYQFNKCTLDRLPTPKLSPIRELMRVNTGSGS